MAKCVYACPALSGAYKINVYQYILEYELSRTLRVRLRNQVRVNAQSVKLTSRSSCRC